VARQSTKLANAYCTFFDSGYLSRGITMIESIRSFDAGSQIYILALDGFVAEYFRKLALERVTVLTVEQLEDFCPELLGVKSSRSRMEYYFTCTPQLFKFIFSQQPDAGLTLSYLDADLYFFSDPRQIREALGDSSVGITAHRFKNPPKIQLQYGLFNAGFLTFRDDANGHVVLDWWANRALEWCFDKPSDGRYANQGYLNSFPDFPGVAIYPSHGMNAAPWNTRGAVYSRDARGSVLVDGDALVFFHFHGMRKWGRRFVTSELVYRSRLTNALRNLVYVPYAAHLMQNDARVAGSLPESRRVSHRGNGLTGVIGRLRKIVLDALTTVTGNSIPAPSVDPFR
jgi:hypothetical protein